MKIDAIYIQNFRKLYQCCIDFSDNTTLFVGANNSGKTSAMDALAKFLAGRQFEFNDFTISNHKVINNIGEIWIREDCKKPNTLIEWAKVLPTMDIWLNVRPQDIHYVLEIIPTLKWREGLLGVRLLFQPENIEKLFEDFCKAYFEARNIEKRGEKNDKNVLFPKNLCEFIEKKLKSYFTIKSYILDPKKINEIPVQETEFEMECQSNNPLRNIIKVNMVGAQRGFYDPDETEGGERVRHRLSNQMRKYYDKHLDPEKLPTPEDIKLLEVTEKALHVFDDNLTQKFAPAIEELESLGYPGVANPIIKIKSQISPTEALSHDSVIQYSLGEPEDMMLPERYNGLGYQNLISLVFDLISFRDGWMQKGKAASSKEIIEPLQLVLIEEPEAHLHMQVQQVFIRKAYKILRNHEKLHDKTDFSTQLIISTHSSHIAREEKFSNLRYFKRLSSDGECRVATSTVVNLSEVFGKNDDTNRFATRYLQTTYCDIFFADAIILVEGTVENIVVPHFIRCKYSKLTERYITILNINGKHSHRLSPLLDKLALPTLIITDLDSAYREGHHKKAIPQRGKDLISGNYAITNWLLHEKDFDKLLDLPKDKKIITRKKGTCNYQIRIAYQTPLMLNYCGKTIEALSRTFEDSFIYENLSLFKSDFDGSAGELFIKVSELLKNEEPFDKLVEQIFNKLKKSDVKGEFALDLLYSINPDTIAVPSYIAEGLDWLQAQLEG